MPARQSLTARTQHSPQATCGGNVQQAGTGTTILSGANNDHDTGTTTVAGVDAEGAVSAMVYEV